MLHHLDMPVAPKKTINRPLFTLLFAGISGVLGALLFFFLTPYTYGTMPFFYQDVIEPIPPNFSAPLETRPQASTRRQVIGFLPSWSIAQEATVYPEYLDQIIYFGLAIDERGNIIKFDEEQKQTLEWHYFNSPYFTEVMSRARDTNTKVLVALKNFDNESIDTLISNPAATQNAIQQITELMEEYDLDGINIDFEYVTRSDFPTLPFYNGFLQTLSDEMKQINPDAILSIDVNATAVYLDTAYDMVKIGEVTDQVIIMGYDYHRPVSTIAGPNSPIGMPDGKPSLTKTLDSLKGRVPAEKIVLGLPLYGYEWQTYTDTYGSRTIPQTGAIATYKRVRELIEHRDDVSIQYDELAGSPWLVYRQNGFIKQIHYEDERSLSTKIDLIHERDLAGMALWALGYEGDYIEPWIVIKNGMWQ